MAGSGHCFSLCERLLVARCGCSALLIECHKAVAHGQFRLDWPTGWYGREKWKSIANWLTDRYTGSITQQERINEINRQIKLVEKKPENIANAIENGCPLDETLLRRIHRNKVAREALFIELAGVRRDASLPAVDYLKASQVDVFGKVLRENLLTSGSPLAKCYLNILVDEIVVEDKTATIKGSYAALAETMEKIKLGNLNQVPSFIPDWRARRDSNSLPLGS
jgi:site-specific DNA recombinase